MDWQEWQIRTRYPLKVGFKHYRRKPAAVKTFLGLALNSRETKRLEVNFSDFTQASRKSKVSQDMDNDAEVHPPWGRNRKARVSRMPSGNCDKQDGDHNTASLQNRHGSGARVENQTSHRSCLLASFRPLPLEAPEISRPPRGRVRRASGIVLVG